MRKVIIIDDDEDSRKLLQTFLRLRNFSVQAFATAEDFLQQPALNADLFIIDINLGGMSGVEVCQHIKEDSLNKHTPVIIVSAHPEVERLSLDACADDFLARPFSPSLLLEKINKHLK